MTSSLEDGKPRPAWTRVFSFLSTAALWLAGLGLVLMTAFVSWQVFGRYVLNQSPNWTELGSVMLMSWFIFLGAAVGIREDYHLGFDVLLYVVPLRGKRALRMISDIVRSGACDIPNTRTSSSQPDNARRLYDMSI